MIRVIIVDDEILARIGIQTLLEQDADIQVKGNFGFGEDAIRFCQNSTVDIVLTDIEMAELDGFSLIQTIKENNYAKGVIVISSHSKFEYARKALDKGVDAYILKHELESELLIKTIKETHKKVTVSADTPQKPLLLDSIQHDAGDLLYQLGVVKFLSVDTENCLPSDIDETMFGHLLENIVGKYNNATPFAQANKHRFIVFTFDEPVSEIDANRISNEICIDISENLELYLNKRVIIITSSLFGKMSSISRHYNQVMDLGNVFQYIDDNIMEKVGLNEAAAISGMSVANFCKKFKEYTGITFTQHVNEQRINRVKMLIKNKSNSLGEIAGMTGFTNENYMTRVFKQVTGKTISMWRKGNFE